MVWLAVTTIGDRDADDRRRLGRGLRVGAGGGGEGLLGLEHVFERSSSACRAASSALFRFRARVRRSWNAAIFTWLSEMRCSMRSIGRRLAAISPSTAFCRSIPEDRPENEALPLPSITRLSKLRLVAMARVRSGALVDQRPERLAQRRVQAQELVGRILLDQFAGGAIEHLEDQASAGFVPMRPDAHGAIGKERLQARRVRLIEREVGPANRSIARRPPMGSRAERPPGRWAPRARRASAPRSPAWALRQDPRSWLHIPVIRRLRQGEAGGRTPSRSLAYCSSRSRFWGS